MVPTLDEQDSGQNDCYPRRLYCAHELAEEDGREHDREDRLQAACNDSPCGLRGDKIAELRRICPKNGARHTAYRPVRVEGSTFRHEKFRQKVVS